MKTIETTSTHAAKCYYSARDTWDAVRTAKIRAGLLNATDVAAPGRFAVVPVSQIRRTKPKRKSVKPKIGPCLLTRTRHRWNGGKTCVHCGQVKL